MIKMQIVIMKMLVIFHTNLKFNGLKEDLKRIEEEKKIIETIDQIQKKIHPHSKTKNI